jgi:fumarate reductase subunit D
MNVRRSQCVTAAIGGIVALALILFPSWYAVHPKESALTYPIGIAWIWSPPAPPNGLETMRVEHGNTGFIFGGIVILITVAACWLQDRKKRAAS